MLNSSCQSFELSSSICLFLSVFDSFELSYNRCILLACSFYELHECFSVVHELTFLLYHFLSFEAISCRR